ncbi:MAG: sulfotransferase [Desulforhopalus sp.]
MANKHQIVAQEQTELERLILNFHDISMRKFRNDFLPKPTFIGVGAGRCGTSALYAMLRSHPEVYLSPLKEVNFFGIRDKESSQFGLTFSEYLNYFLGAAQGQQIGEVSPAYLTYPLSLERIKYYLPNARLIITVRDPYERFVSQFKHHSDKHKINSLDKYAKEALSQYKAGWPNGKNWYAPVKNLYQSLYYEGIDFIYNNFEKENIIIIHQNDLSRNSSSVLQQICKFLGIEEIKIENRRTNMSDSAEVDLEITDSRKQQLKDIFLENQILLKKNYGIVF